MKRDPSWNRVHFSCSGSIDAVGEIDVGMVRVGDTASGIDDRGSLCLWRCEAIGPAVWVAVERWSERRAAEYVLAADVFAVFGEADGEG